jgi:hypothetical protein
MIHHTFNLWLEGFVSVYHEITRRVPAEASMPLLFFKFEYLTNTTFLIHPSLHILVKKTRFI